MAARAEDLLPVEYFHVVFTLPAEIARIAYWNKREVYGLLFKVSAETVTTIVADPRHLGARLGMISVLHTWGLRTYSSYWSLTIWRSSGEPPRVFRRPFSWSQATIFMCSLSS